VSAPVVIAAEEAASPLTEGIVKLLHELSVLPLKGDHLSIADSFNPANFTLTNYMFFMLIALTLLAVFFVVASRKASLVPKGIYNIAEAGVSFVRDSLCVDIMGPEGRKYFPFIGWGIVVFIVYNAIGIKKSGVGPYVKSFVPSGTPAWLSPLIFLLEIVSHLLRPFTLGVRLFANMYAGHIMLGVFAVFMAVSLEHFTASSAVVLPLSFLMQVILRAFELFVAVLQAYIFSILTAVYINGALHQTEH